LPKISGSTEKTTLYFIKSHFQKIFNLIYHKNINYSIFLYKINTKQRSYF
jgi:hypothetical protein